MSELRILCKNVLLRHINPPETSEADTTTRFQAHRKFKLGVPGCREPPAWSRKGPGGLCVTDLPSPRARSPRPWPAVGKSLLAGRRRPGDRSGKGAETCTRG